MSSQTVVPEPYDQALIDVGDGHQIHWAVRGNPDGKPALVLHGGPGSGATRGPRRLFDPDRYRIIEFDQRNCGASTPHASRPEIDLSTNTTAHLIGDIEQLRQLLDIDRWLVWGGSWGTTLGLAYAEAHPQAVSQLVLASVVTTTPSEIDWVTRTMGRVFPEAWRAFVEHLPADRRDGNLALAYNQLLMDPDPAVHEPAAAAWCEWEDVHVSIADGYEPHLRYEDPAFRLAFARLVTHYWANAAFMSETQLLDEASSLDGIEVFMAHGRLDISAPAAVAVALAEAIPNCDLFIAEREGHGGPEMSSWMRSLTDRLATEPPAD